MYGTPTGNTPGGGGLSFFQKHLLAAAGGAAQALWRNGGYQMPFRGIFNRFRRRAGPLVRRAGGYLVRRIGRGLRSYARRRLFARRRPKRRTIGGSGGIGTYSGRATRRRTRTGRVRTMSKTRTKVAGRKRKGTFGGRGGGRRKYRRTGFTKRLNTANAAIPYQDWFWQGTATAAAAAAANSTATRNLPLSTWVSGLSISGSTRPDGSSGNLAFPFSNHPLWYWKQALINEQIQFYGLAPNWVDVMQGTVATGQTDSSNTQIEKLMTQDVYQQFRRQRSLHIITNMGTTPVIVRQWVVRAKKDAFIQYMITEGAANQQSQSGNFFDMLEAEIVNRSRMVNDSRPAPGSMYRMWDEKPTKYPGMRRYFHMRMKQFTLGVNGRRAFRFVWRKPKHLSLFDISNANFRGFETTVDNSGEYVTYWTAPTYGRGQTQVYYQFIGTRGVSNDANGYVDYGPANISIQHKRSGKVRTGLIQPKMVWREQHDQAASNTEYSRRWGANPVVQFHNNMPTGPTDQGTALPVQLFAEHPSTGELVPMEAGTGGGANALAVQQTSA